MKKSLIVSEKEKYPNRSSPVSPGSAVTKPVEQRYAPTITLEGKQVDAFCGCSLKVGEKGTATVHFLVKAVSAGNSYGDDLPKKGAKQKVTLALTHVERDGDDEAGEDKPEEDAETPEKEVSEDEGEAPDAPSISQETVSPKDAKLED